MNFPINMRSYKRLRLDLTRESLSPRELTILKNNILLARAAITFFTTRAGVRGLGGHSGGAFDIVPEALILDGFMQVKKNKVHPVFFDEAGHRVALQYFFSALNGDLSWDDLLKYREFKGKLPGHPEKGLTPGVGFSSGRLGHLWSYVNGIALAHPSERIILLGSDGSQQEGGDAEAARFCVAHKLNVKVIVDDNDVTIAGHPSEYMPGFSVEKTLRGHGMSVDCATTQGLQTLYRRLRKALLFDGPVAVVNKRKMAPGVKGVEGTTHGHDVFKKEPAQVWLSQHGFHDASQALEGLEKVKDVQEEYHGSSSQVGKCRDEFGKVVNEILSDLSKRERLARVRVIDNDLEGSCGLHHIRKAYPEVFLHGGIMERGNYSAAAGFGQGERQGVFATFAAFLEMCISEITMARLNHSNVLAHFSHSGVDWMADNTCHFGINNFFADGGLAEDESTRLYFPADVGQLRAIVQKIFWDKGLRFVFSTRSPVPLILRKNGKPFYDSKYTFSGKDEIIRSGKKGYVIAYGEMLYRALDCVEHLRSEGIDVGLINKPLLNKKDKSMLKKLAACDFVLVVESQNIKTGLGSRFGTWLLEAGFCGKYDHLGTWREGEGGIYKQIGYQGLDRASIAKAVRRLCK